MPLLRKLVLVLLACAAFCWSAPAHKHGWHLLWSDEFNSAAGTPPDSFKWTAETSGGGFGNKELETYTASPENLATDGAGHLSIHALKSSDGHFTSGRIQTKGKFSFAYGKVEARIKIPFGQGIWPAFWMLGADVDTAHWPACGELDIMENIGKEPAIVHGTIHGPGYSGGHSIGHPFELPHDRRFASAFHNYAVEWAPESIVFLVDNKSYARMTPASLPPGAQWVFNHPFFVLLNLAVGGAWPGNPDATTVFPQTLLVDWVRVWQRNK